MPIVFNKIEENNTKPEFKLPEAGPYFAEVVKAEMRQPATEGKSPYFNIQYTITDETGASKGTIFDMMSTSEADFCVRRLTSFMTAVGFAGIPFNTYDDICKVLPSRKLGFYIEKDTSDYVKNNPDKARMSVSSKEQKCFYTTAEIAQFMPEVAPKTAVSTGEPLNALEVASDDLPF